MSFKMAPSQNPCHINLHGLKAKFTKTLGPKRAGQYFGILGKFFSCKLSKAEFDRQILRTVEKEYIFLHNQLIRAIWTNALSDGAPPLPRLHRGSSGLQRKILPTKASDFVSSPQGTPSPRRIAPSNGFLVTDSPRKGRLGIRDRKAKATQNMLATHLKGEVSTSQGAIVEERAKALEDGVDKFETSRGLTKVDSVQRSDIDDDSSNAPDAKRLRVDSSDQLELLPTEVTYEKSPIFMIESANQLIKDGTSAIGANHKIKAPMGIPFCVGSVGAAANSPSNRKLLSLNSKVFHSRIAGSSDLADIDSLQRRVNSIATLEGLDNASYESVACLKQALEIHLKKLVAESIGLVQSRQSRDKQRSTSLLRGLEVKRGETLCRGLSSSSNGFLPDLSPSRLATMPLEAGETMENGLLIKPIDFKVAMNNCPQQLGQNWPTILERLSFRVFEQQDKQCWFGP